MLRQPTIPGQYRRGPKPLTAYFQPAPRGTLKDSLASKGQLAVIAPESPRPAELLRGVAVVGADRLTADDAALHEFLVSRAYEDDQHLTADTHALDMAEAVRYLGSRVERDDIRASLHRLRETTVCYGSPEERRCEDVPLLESWVEVAPGEDVIRYRLPDPLRVLMRKPPEFAYIEMAALPKMRSKFSSRLYKMAALLASKRKWVAGDDNVITIEGTPDEVADWVGFPKEQDGRVHAGKLRARFLAKVVDDFVDVRAFRLECEVVEGKGRGKPIQSVVFRLHLAPPSRHTVPMFFKPSEDVFRIGSKDLPQYRVESRTWRRAAKQFARTLGKSNRMIHDMWLVALHEALSGVALTEGFHTRPYRGRRLLQEIERRGADNAAWGLVTSEADDPDLSSKTTALGWVTLVAEADESRMLRIGMGKRRRARAARPAPAFVVSEDEGLPVAEARDPAVPQATFEACSKIVLTCDEAMSTLDVDAIVGTSIQQMLWTGERPVKLALRYMDAGEWGEWVIGTYPVSEADLDAIQQRHRRHLDGVEEYVA